MTVSHDAHRRPTGDPAASGLPVVLVHGYLGGSAQWADLAAFLSRRFRTLALDLPGFGEASALRAPPSIEGFAEHVIAELDALGVDRCMLLGHSMGGMIVQEVARRIPQRIDRLVLYGTGALGSMPDRFEPLEVSLDRLLRDGVGPTARRIAATWLLHGEAHPAFETLSSIGARADAEAARSALAAMAAWDGREGLGALTMPSLVVWGERDRSYRWAQVERLWTGLPEASLAVIPGASHAAHLEKPRIFQPILEDFLTS